MREAFASSVKVLRRQDATCTERRFGGRENCPYLDDVEFGALGQVFQNQPATVMAPPAAMLDHCRSARGLNSDPYRKLLRIKESGISFRSRNIHGPTRSLPEKRLPDIMGGVIDRRCAASQRRSAPPVPTVATTAFDRNVYIFALRDAFIHQDTRAR